mgnify:CR=1 FL=1
MDNPDFKQICVQQWQRQQDWIVSLNLLSQEQMLATGSALVKVIGILCGAALVTLVGAVEKNIISNSAAYYSSLAYLAALFLIVVTQALSCFNMQYAVNITALIINRPVETNEEIQEENPVLLKEVQDWENKIKRSYKFGWTMGIASALIFFATTTYVIHSVYL